ncbi:MAG: response regulator [Methanolinea sp.]
MTTILIVDDNAQNLYLLETILRGEGYTVTSARNGATALEMARKDPPDMVISDILMPVMDGFELCRRWKADETLRDIPFVFYTATYTDPRDEKFAMSLGADLFIVKPQKTEVLARLILDVLQRYREKRAPPPARPLGEEMEILRQYNEVLFRKLEKKMRDLENEIAEKCRVEKRLSESETFLNAIIENIPDMVFVKDARDLSFVRFNRAAEQLLGYSREEMYGKTDFDFFPPHEAAFFREKDREVLDGNKILDIPRESIHTKHRGTRILHTKKIAVPDTKGEPRYLLGISEDITDQVLAEEALHRATKKLNILNAITFEDIQNILYSLSGYVDLAAKDHHEPHRDRYLEKMGTLLQSLEKTLEFARIFQSLGQNPPAWQDVTFTFLLAASHIDMRGISHRIDVRGLEIYADPLLEKVFYFLIENVIAHGAGATEISLSCRESEQGLTIFFEDDGVGIPEEKKSLIFEKDALGKKNRSLFLVREILSITEISIRETGEYGRGARFEIAVPVGMYRFPEGHLPTRVDIAEKT